MAVGLRPAESLAPVAGIRVGVAELGGRREPRPDIAVLTLAENSRCTAVFTRNRFVAAPVIVAREHLSAGPPRYLLVNAGNANAGTGSEGIAAARACCAHLAERAGCAPQAVVPFSTGVIGEPLPVERFPAAIDAALECASDDGWMAAAGAIMTTDTVPKGVSRVFEIDGRPAVVTGIAKGSGMIRPDMATMLAFLATDADVAPGVLDRCLRDAVDASFNCITVDGDTSTNDACVLAATGAAGTSPLASDRGSGAQAFREAVSDVCRTLAQAIVRDAEGATKFITVDVGGGRSREECYRVAYAVANSPLVKTAMFASDANWGRILAAVGRAGVQDLEVDGVAMTLGGVRIVEGGARAPGYRDEDGQRAVAAEEIDIVITLGRGEASARVWTSDLSHDYVTINAEYRT